MKELGTSTLQCNIFYLNTDTLELLTFILD